MLRFILDMTEVPPSWLACAGECILDVLRLKLLLPGGGLTPPLGLLLGPPCADLNDEWAACKVTHVVGCHYSPAYHGSTMAAPLLYCSGSYTQVRYMQDIAECPVGLVGYQVSF